MIYYIASAILISICLISISFICLNKANDMSEERELLNKRNIMGYRRSGMKDSLGNALVGCPPGAKDLFRMDNLSMDEYNIIITSLEKDPKGFDETRITEWYIDKYITKGE